MGLLVPISMYTFCQFLVIGVGTAIALGSLDRADAQSYSFSATSESQAQSIIPNSPQADNLFSPQKLNTQEDPVRLGQTSSDPLPPLEPGTPLPAPSPAPVVEPEPTSPSPSPIETAPATPSEPPISDIPPELQRLNPDPNPLSLPNQPSQVQIEVTEPISLQQALDLAQRNNRELQVAQLQLRRTQAGLREARSALLPTVGAQASLIRQRGGSSGGFVNQQQTGIPDSGSGQPTTPGTDTPGTGVAPGTPTSGGTTPGTTPGTGIPISGTPGTGTQDPNNPSLQPLQVAGDGTPATGTTPDSTTGVGTGVTGDSETPVFNTVSGTLEANYNVFTSGRRGATIRAAEEQVRSAELEVERQAQQLRLDVTNDYYDIQQADQQIRIAQAAVANSQASLKDAQALERAGLGTRFDSLRAQVQLANDTQSLTQALSQRQVARRALVRRLSLARDANVSAADPVAVAGRWNPTLEETIVQAFQSRAELTQQLAQRNISQARRRIALSELGPQVGVFANFTPSVVLNNISDTAGYSYALGGRVSLNIFDGGAARARAAQEEANAAIAETNFADTRQQVRFEVEQAYANLQSNFENIQTASVAQEQAQESLRLARLRFQAGVGTQTDVIDAQAALTRAQSNQLQAVLDYNRALASLERAVSNLPTPEATLESKRPETKRKSL